MLRVTFSLIDKLPDRYESRAVVVINSPGDTDGQKLGAQITAVTQRATSRPFLEGIIRRYQLNPGQGATDSVVQQLRKDIKAETKLREYYPQFPESILLTYRDTNPQRAQHVLNDIVTLFNETNEIIRQRATSESGLVDSQLKQIEAPLKQSGRERGVVRLPEAVGLTGRSAEEVRTTRLSLVTAREALQDKEFSLEQQIATQKKAIAEQEKIVKNTPPPTAPDGRATGAYGTLLVKKSELEAQLKDYLAQYTEKNAKVTNTRLQLAEIERQLATYEKSTAAETAVAASPEARELRAMQRELQKLETDLQVTRREMQRKQETLAKLPDVPAEARVKSEAATVIAGAGEAEAQYDTLKERYTRLLDRQDSLNKIGSGAPIFQVIDAPNLSALPTGPNRLMFKILSAAAALVLGLLIALALELSKLSRIRDERDIEFYLGTPVMGFIPETLTPAERGRARRHLVARYLTAAVAAVVAIPLLIMLFNKLQLFDLIANR